MRVSFPHMKNKNTGNYRNNERFVSLLDNCRELRKSLTDAEQLLWYFLRNRRFQNFKFRRQHQFGSYILDFYCPELKVVIELDGGQHYGKEIQERDLARDAYLRSQGIKVLRFSNNEVFKETEAVLMKIWETFYPD